MRIAISTVIILDNRILLVKKRETWILPGGKPEESESDIECLCREVKQELSETQLEEFQYYKTFEGKTPYSGDLLQARVYFSRINGQLHGPSSEISGVEWINEFSEYNISEITLKVINELKRDSYL